jgi:hypothetical protein
VTEAAVVAVVAETVVVSGLVVAAVPAPASVVLAGSADVVVSGRAFLPMLTGRRAAAGAGTPSNSEGRRHAGGKDGETADDSKLDHAISALSQHSRRPLS